MKTLVQGILKQPYLPPKDRPLCGLSKNIDNGIYHRSKGTSQWHLIITFSGKGEFITPCEKKCQLTRGKIILIQANISQKFYRMSSKPWIAGWAHFTPNPIWISRLNWTQVDKGYWEFTPPNPSRSHFIIREFKKLLRNSKKITLFSDQRLLHSIEGILISTCEINTPTATLSPSRISSSVNWIDNNFSKPFNLIQLSKMSHLSISHFVRLFRNEMGTTPRKYWEYCRIQEAKRLLVTTSYSISKIAQITGFENMFYFSNRFKKLIGKSPTLFKLNPSLNTFQPQIPI